VVIINYTFFAKPSELHSMSKASNSNNPELIRVAVSKTNHYEIKQFLKEDGTGQDIGKFYDRAAMKELSHLKNQSPFSKIDSQLLFDNGWTKHAGSSYVRGNYTIWYSGTEWFYNGELLTEQNYLEKIK